MIRRLPKDVVDRIAAGEVIERPSSVVKELVENALDAGATRVRVELEGGGKRAIRVRDDGAGMDRKDIELAFVPHATSKLAEVDDLLAIASYGFRGEALASIGAISRARIVSRRADEDEGLEVRCESGVLSEPRPAGAPVGTLVEASQLFFNVPARSRFLKGDAAEGARCLEIVSRFAMVSHGVGFEMTHDGRVVLEIAPDASPRERAASLMGDVAARELIAVTGRIGDVAVEALLGLPDRAKSSSLHQYFFLNGRVVKDGTLKAAVRQAYREFLAPNLSPTFVLMLTMDPAEVDVNVHPAKTEVRFRDTNAVFRAVYGVVLDGLRKADLAARPKSGAFGRGPQTTGASSDVAAAANSEERSVFALRSGSPIVPAPRSPSAAYIRHADRAESHAILPGFEDAADRVAEGIEPVAEATAARHASPEASTATDPAAGHAQDASVPAVPRRTGRGFLRAFETYILYEAGSDLVLVDQHALHERVVYERLRRAIESGPLPSQRLVAPIAIEVGRAAALAAEDRIEDFRRLGIEIAPLSPTALGVHAIPPLLHRGDLKGMIEALLIGGGGSGGATGESGGEDAGRRRAARAPLEERLHTMACRAAVKAGDPMNDSEIEALLAEAERLPESKACPHGRPTVVRVTRHELERSFRRTGF